MWVGVFLSLAGLALLAGCASNQGKYQSQREPDYRSKMERVLIVYYNEDQSTLQMGKGFSTNLCARLTELLAQKGVVSEVVRPSERAVDQYASIRAAAARFRPGHLLYFGVGRVSSRGGVYRPSLEALPQFVHVSLVHFIYSLHDVTRGKTVWRGEGHYNVLPYPKVVADEFYEHLAAEQFFKSR